MSQQGELSATDDSFPEVAYFEVPLDGSSSKRGDGRSREILKHPAFREISIINGEINRMNPKTLKSELDALCIDTRGSKDVLRKRLKASERRRVLQAASIDDPGQTRQHYDHLLVIDFEATCEEHQTKNFLHEIIEFPAVLVDVSRAAVVSEFHCLVRPVLNPTLSHFCKQLTGIDQRSVSSAEEFPAVLEQFGSWLSSQGVAIHEPATKLAVATDGPWDMARFLLMQCSISKIPFPPWARSWINLRKIFSNFYVTKRLCLSEMLTTLGLEFQGRPHCGLDDARNIAAIAVVLLKDGAAPRVNETIAHLPRTTPPSLKGSNVSSVTLKEFETSERRRHRACERRSDPPLDSLSQSLDACLTISPPLDSLSQSLDACITPHDASPAHCSASSQQLPHHSSSPSDTSSPTLTAATRATHSVSSQLPHSNSISSTQHNVSYSTQMINQQLPLNSHLPSVDGDAFTVNQLGNCSNNVDCESSYNNPWYRVISDATPMASSNQSVSAYDSTNSIPNPVHRNCSNTDSYGINKPLSNSMRNNTQINGCSSRLNSYSSYNVEVDNFHNTPSVNGENQPRRYKTAVDREVFQGKSSNGTSQQYSNKRGNSRGSYSSKNKRRDGDVHTNARSSASGGDRRGEVTAPPPQVDLNSALEFPVLGATRRGHR